jgi:hypothetical protein
MFPVVNCSSLELISITSFSLLKMQHFIKVGLLSFTTVSPPYQMQPLSG